MYQNNKDSELVLGLITTVGTDTEGVISCLRDHLKQFRYKTDVISVSEEVISEFGPPTKELDSEYERIEYFMDLGNRIRKMTDDNSFLMKGVTSCIVRKREGGTAPWSRRAYIIKSIKHPEEVEYLREVYGDGFHLIGITSTYEQRIKFLVERKALTSKTAKELLERDKNEELGHGQHTQDAFQQADYFISVGDSNHEIQSSVSRLLDLLFGDPFKSPSFNEFAMFMAYVSSLRSADLSRQVGALVVNNNEIYASGANDCPKAFGGLYYPIYQDGTWVDEDGGRDHTIGYDSNVREQQKIIDKILENLSIDNNEDNVNKVKRAGIGSITEYGRVVHAEMEALLMCSRNNISSRGCDMYVTTFPCHNCAKHIIAAGIKRVIYIEPYPKSKAKEFYPNEITEDEDEDNKVQFIPFTGVGPRRFIDLFSVKSQRLYSKVRKERDGNKCRWERSNAQLRSPLALLTYLDSEIVNFKDYSERSTSLKEEMQNGK